MRNDVRPNSLAVDVVGAEAYALSYVTRRLSPMTTVTATEARKLLYKLVDDVSDSHEPVQITGKRGNAVLVGEDDWRAVQETLYLVSIPGMRESILEGMKAPVDECTSELDW
jgi:antitoxin YefM